MYQNVIFICISRCNQNWPFLVIFHADVSRTERVIYMGQMFKNEPNKICGTQPLRNLKGYGLFKQRSSYTNFSRSILEYFVPYISWYNCAKFYHYWICVTDFSRGYPHPRPLAAWKRPVMYKVKRICQNHNKSKEVSSKT